MKSDRTRSTSAAKRLREFWQCSPLTAVEDRPPQLLPDRPDQPKGPLADSLRARRLRTHRRQCDGDYNDAI
jgi:hypothetical protein